MKKILVFFLQKITELNLSFNFKRYFKEKVFQRNSNFEISALPIREKKVVSNTDNETVALFQLKWSIHYPV